MADELSSLPPFVAELFRAANEIDHLGASEQKRLMSRAARTILDRREQLNSEVPEANPVQDQLLDDLTTISETESMIVPGVVAAALLSAAEDIRALHVILSHKQQIIVEAEQGGAPQP